MAHMTEYTKKKECEVKALPLEEKKRLVREGKAHWFFPRHVAEQVIICGVALMLLITISTLFPAHLGPKADPFDTPEHIKPEWYFYFTFRWLKLTSLQVGVLGTGAAFMLLLFWPFMDRVLVKKFPDKSISVWLGVVAILTLIVLTIWEAMG